MLLYFPTSWIHCPTSSGIVLDYLAVEAYERMTDAGTKISIVEDRHARNEDPWGRYRFCGIMPLNLFSYDDSKNGKFHVAR